MNASPAELITTSKPYRIGNAGAVAKRLSGDRLHLQHGPIDIILRAWGDHHCVKTAYAITERRFASVLSELVPQLPLLRDSSTATNEVTGTIAKRMTQTINPFQPAFMTPMAAVAGAVADEMLACLAAAGITRAYVNNGGDIALLNHSDTPLTIGILGGYGALDRLAITSDDRIGGVATSGWRGRSQSFGIADAVTVLAGNAAIADAAATLIANHVTVESPAIERQPANTVSADTDLGERPITIGVGQLSTADITIALQRGCEAAERQILAGRISAAYLALQGQTATIGPGTDIWPDGQQIEQNTHINPSPHNKGVRPCPLKKH